VIIINTYLSAVAARGSTALCISDSAHQPATDQPKRVGLTWLPFPAEKSLYNAPRGVACCWLGSGMPSFCLRLYTAVLATYPCGRFQRQLFSFQPGHTLGSHLGNHPDRARRINLGSGHRWSCASDLHQAVDLRDSTRRTGRPACHQFKARCGAPLPNIVHWLNEPAFTLENCIYRWQQLVEEFCLYDVTCCP
jgi:hypothetical protein